MLEINKDILKRKKYVQQSMFDSYYKMEGVVARVEFLMFSLLVS